ncbi:hypothetical protein BE08_25760 [Sorangium cellulosum]|uniref:Secreted protein n=1 Tax=Sorangium cellulosum TaxID=56 RepID=A0A150P9L2_SORCE|nr:hypothetical protein BE08_25760 [Sorangium cellulosum]
MSRRSRRWGGALIAIAGLCSACAPGDQADPTLSDPDATHIEGQLTQDGVSLYYDARKSEESVHLELHAGDGRVLVKSVRSGDRIVSSLLDGAFVVAGPAALLDARRSLSEDELSRLAAEVELSGDPAALNELASLPEYALVDDLGRELQRREGWADTLGVEQLGQAQHAAVCTECDKPESGGGPVSGGGCDWFTKLTCGGAIAACVGGCVGANVGYAACMVPCLAGVGMAFCRSCI